MEKPTKAGFYWGKSGTYQWFNLIVEVYGESPFFKLRAWHRWDNKLVTFEASDIKEWGPEIVVPE